MLDWKPDKLAQNAPSQSEAQEARKLSQGSHKQTSYPRVQWENTLDKRRGYRTPGTLKNMDTQGVAGKKGEQERGECMVKEQSWI